MISLLDWTSKQTLVTYKVEDGKEIETHIQSYGPSETSPVSPTEMPSSSSQGTWQLHMKMILSKLLKLVLMAKMLMLMGKILMLMLMLKMILWKMLMLMLKMILWKMLMLLCLFKSKGYALQGFTFTKV